MFAKLQDGGVTTVANDNMTNSAPPGLDHGVCAVYSCAGMFVAAKADSTVVNWGGPNIYSSSFNTFSSEVAPVTGGAKLAGVTCTAFGPAYLMDDGTVLGVNKSNQTVVLFGSGAISVSSTLGAFAVLANNGSVTTFGYPGTQLPNSSAVPADLASGVVKLFATTGAFAAVHSNGGLTTW